MNQASERVIPASKPPSERHCKLAILIGRVNHGRAVCEFRTHRAELHRLLRPQFGSREGQLSFSNLFKD